jgi:hypothetical protein
VLEVIGRQVLVGEGGETTWVARSVRHSQPSDLLHTDIQHALHLSKYSIYTIFLELKHGATQSLAWIPGALDPCPSPTLQRRLKIFQGPMIASFKINSALRRE